MALRDHTRVGIDANVLIYLVEDRGLWAERAEELFTEIEKRHIAPICSALVATELLQHPLRQGNERMVQEYQRILFTESEIQFVNITIPVAVHAATLAAQYRLKTPDAVHLACALEGGATAFVTADKGIKGIKELEIIQL